MSFFTNLTAVQKFLITLTWKKIFQVSVFLIIVGISWVMYETRESIFGFISLPRLASHAPGRFGISRKTATDLAAQVDKSGIIIAIQLTIVDFQKNTKSIIYTYTDNPNVSEIYKRFEEGGFVDLPIFSSDIQNNRRMVDLINGEFVCVPYSDTLVFRIVPESGKYISTVCESGIPPLYGKFTGIISVYLKINPAPEEVDQIRALAKGLSASIYEKDFR
jgi:hypothetical protein